MRISIVLLTAAIALLHCGWCEDASAANSGDWPFLRGPRFDGCVDDAELVDGFAAQGPPVLWTRTLGVGYSGLTASGTRVYTQYQTLGGQYLVCLDANSGETIWSYRYGLPYDPAGMYPGPRGTPTLHDGRVYFTGPGGLAGCLSADRGRLIWSVELLQELDVERVEFGYSCSPVIVGDMVLLPAGRGASLAALDAKTGAVLWTAGEDPISHVPAYPISWRGESLAIGYFRNSLCAFDLKTGTQKWRMSISSGYDEHAAWPIYSEPYLWISGPFQAGSELLELTQEAPGYRTVWKNRLLSNDICSSVLVDGHLYGFDLKEAQSKPHRPSRGQFVCLEFLTGRECWSQGDSTRRRSLETTPAEAGTEPPIGHASVLAADGKLILFNDTGELILARANPERYEELGRAQILGGEIVWTAPTLHRGRLYVRNHSRAACVLLADPTTLRGVATEKLLSVADIPQSSYRDVAGLLIPVEPEFAMDAPTLRQMRLWFYASLLCLALSGGAAGAVCGATALFGKIRDQRADKETRTHAQKRLYRWVWWTAAACLGAVGTTAGSLWHGEFIFTWPVCLYFGFAATGYQVGLGQVTSRRAAWTRRLALLAFVALCVAYFLLCRRLSLVAHAAFLIGFPAALPAILIARWQAASHPLPRIREAAMIVAGFALYYWACVGVVLWKYG